MITPKQREAARARIEARKLQWATEARKREHAAERTENSAIDRGLILFN